MRTLLGCLALTLGLGACDAHRTILIPRFSGAVPTDPFAGSVFESEREVDGTSYALVAVAFDETLVLAARTSGAFAGALSWRVGAQTLALTIPASVAGGTLPVRIEASDRTLTAELTRGPEGTTVRFTLSHGTLREGDGTLVLEFWPEGGEPVVIPGHGRLRGVYLKT